MNVPLSSIYDLHVLAHVLKHRSAGAQDILVLLVAGPTRLSIPSARLWLLHVNNFSIVVICSQLFVPFFDGRIDRLLTPLLPPRGRSLVRNDRLTLSPNILLRCVFLNSHSLLRLVVGLPRNKPLTHKESRPLLGVDFLSLLRPGSSGDLP